MIRDASCSYDGRPRGIGPPNVEAPKPFSARGGVALTGCTIRSAVHKCACVHCSAALIVCKYQNSPRMHQQHPEAEPCRTVRF